MEKFASEDLEGRKKSIDRRGSKKQDKGVEWRGRTA